MRERAKDAVMVEEQPETVLAMVREAIEMLTAARKADGQNGLGPVRMPAPAGTADRSSSSSSIAAVNCEL